MEIRADIAIGPFSEERIIYMLFQLLIKILMRYQLLLQKYCERPLCRRSQ